MGTTLLALCCGVVLGWANGMPHQVETMTVSKMRMADLENSATGYTYSQQHGQPATLVRYDKHGNGHFYDAPAPVHIVADHEKIDAFQPVVTFGTPESRIATYDQNQGLFIKDGLQAVPLSTPYVGAYVPVIAKANPVEHRYIPDVHDGKGEVHGQIDVVEDDDDHDEDSDEDDDDSEEGDDFDVHGGDLGPNGVFVPGGVITDVGAHHGTSSSGHGKQYNVEEHAEHGERGDKGFKDVRNFDKGEKEKHDSEHQAGHYDSNSGHGGSHSEADGQYGHHEESVKGEKGDSHGNSAYHKKGHKTTGYHNVYHKDEYKKNTDFYDEDHKSGHHDKHASFDEHHAAEEGGHKEGGHQDSGYENQVRGDKGNYDKGHQHSQTQGHKGKEGEEIYHDNHADYVTNGGLSKANEHGYLRSHR
ncbi:sarcoplasmic reticulum histidine-rich calcium-binding protein-like [Orussus abietinus]|uniref:sarcoplasmic reticulum histidine-rich calcium-binding protein-like n=1 Tax=Orussus abietinus TaxID=222816 RepID=UPI000C71625E|nr:sarcoplasmic reticulum histidine-rich calcium-binding protein-like [Orussus abietinus]